MTSDDILLKSSTDELEILEFTLSGKIFGVNVMKVQSIEQFEQSKLTALPGSTPAYPGVFLFRDKTIPLIDLNEELNLRSDVDDGSDRDTDRLSRHAVVLVTQFNSIMIAFRVDSASRIHRIHWSDINPMADIFNQGSLCAFTGSVNIDGHETLILDMEQISEKHFHVQSLLDLNIEEYTHPLQHERSNIKIVLAEDSKTVQHVICKVLAEGGYTNVTTFDNGKIAYDALSKMIETAAAAGKDLSSYVNLIISDIEMPQMDGLTLCHQIKHRLNQTDLPVVIYSSLRRDQMLYKCKEVKADAYISKPNCAGLVQMVDSICLDKKIAGMPYSI